MTKKTELSISGMTCGHCQTAVTEALQAVGGVQAVKVDLDKGLADVSGDVQSEALVAAVVEEGYGATLLNVG